jgi:hypothetical protein
MTEFLDACAARIPAWELHLMQYSSHEAPGTGFGSGEIDRRVHLQFIRDPAGTGGPALAGGRLAIAWGTGLCGGERVSRRPMGSAFGHALGVVPGACPFQYLLTEAFAHKGFRTELTIVGRHRLPPCGAWWVAECGTDLGLARDERPWRPWPPVRSALWGTRAR